MALVTYVKPISFYFDIEVNMVKPGTITIDMTYFDYMKALDRIWSYPCERNEGFFWSTLRDFTDGKPQNLVLNSFFFKIYSNEPQFWNYSLEWHCPYFRAVRVTLESVSRWKAHFDLFCKLGLHVRFFWQGSKGCRCFINKLENY